MTEKKKMELVFQKGCFDNFEGTPEELAELVAHIKQMVESGEILEHGRPLSEEEEEELMYLLQAQELNNRRQ